MSAQFVNLYFRPCPCSVCNGKKTLHTRTIRRHLKRAPIVTAPNALPQIITKPTCDNVQDPNIHVPPVTDATDATDATGDMHTLPHLPLQPLDVEFDIPMFLPSTSDDALAVTEDALSSIPESTPMGCFIAPWRQHRRRFAFRFDCVFVRYYHCFEYRWQRPRMPQATVLVVHKVPHLKSGKKWPFGPLTGCCISKPAAGLENTRKWTESRHVAQQRQLSKTTGAWLCRSGVRKLFHVSVQPWSHHPCDTVQSLQRVNNQLWPT